MSRSLALAMIGLLAAAAAPAQQPPAPFAMQPGAAAAQPAPPSAAPPQGGGSGGAPRPFDMGGRGPRAPAPGPAAAPPAPVVPPVPVVPPAAQPASAPREAPASPAAPAGAGPGRFVVPEEALRLEGEMDARTWSVFLTQEEAADEAALTVAYTNAIFVMPEASRLRASLNGEVVLDAPIESPGGLRTIRVPVRRNLLRAGQNRVRFEVSQRHRTDCSVNATYELWTQLDGAATRLTFARGGARLRSLDDLPAVGADVTGTTTLRAHVPGLAAGQAGSRFLRAVQAIAIRGRYQHLVVQVADQPAAGRAAGAVTLVVGTAGEIRGLVEGLPQEATARAWAGIVADPRLGEVVVATGPTAADVDAAVETLAAPTLRPMGVIRTEVDTLAWSAPDTPLVAGERSIRLSSLDIATQEFSGRRFSTSFKIAMPADFYADAYGEAILYLDAAYATMVRPGSHLDVYVNGRITSTLALNAGRGGIFQRFPVRLTLRNFKPGVNDVTVESILLTESDAQCVPGGTVPGPNRFALFDTSDIVFPEYGRIGRHPNLSAFSASAYPYLLAAEPVPVILGRQDASHYAAAATLLAKLAHSAGRPIPVDTGVTMLSVGARPALVIGTAGQLAPSLLPVVGVSDTIRTSWSNAVEAPSAPAATELPYDAVVERFRERQAAPQPRDPADEIPATGTEEIRDRWRQSLGGGALRREFQSFSTWINRTFDISLTSLNLFEQALEPFTPAPQTSVVLAQGTNPQGGAPWTVLIGRKEDALEAGVARMTDHRIWRGLSGQLSAFQLQTLRLATRAPARTEFIETRPFSLLNTRQVIANWLSTNITFYAAMLLLLCTVLGAVTSMMLRGLGRR